jgi:hypothetical protein
MVDHTYNSSCVDCGRSNFGISIAVNANKSFLRAAIATIITVTTKYAANEPARYRKQRSGLPKSVWRKQRLYGYE